MDTCRTSSLIYRGQVNEVQKLHHVKTKSVFISYQEFCTSTNEETEWGVQEVATFLTILRQFQADAGPSGAGMNICIKALTSVRGVCLFYVNQQVEGSIYTCFYVREGWGFYSYVSENWTKRMLKNKPS